MSADNVPDRGRCDREVMVGNDELQRAIDDLRARIKPENLPYLDAIEQAAGDVLVNFCRLAIFRDTVAGALTNACHD